MIEGYILIPVSTALSVGNLNPVDLIGGGPALLRGCNVTSLSEMIESSQHLAGRGCHHAVHRSPVQPLVSTYGI